MCKHTIANNLFNRYIQYLFYNKVLLVEHKIKK